MSLITFSTKFKGDKEKFRAFYDELGTAIKANGVHFRLALMRQGEFKDHRCDPSFALPSIPRLDSQGLVRLTTRIEHSKEFELANPRPRLGGGGPQDGKEQDGNEDPVSAWNEARNADFATKHRDEIQALFNGICEKTARMISSVCSQDVVNTIANRGIHRSDGISAFHAVREIYAGSKSKNISLLSLYGKFFRLEMLTQGNNLERYTTKFREFKSTLDLMDQKLPVQLVAAVYLSGLTQKFSRIRESISDEENGLRDVNKIIQRVRAHAELLDFQNEREGRTPPPRPPPAPNPITRTNKGLTAGSRPLGKVKCFNCGALHEGGERKCRKPCKICGSTGHTRYACPERKKGGQKPNSQFSQNRSALVAEHFEEINWGLVVKTESEGSALIVRKRVYLDSGADDHFVHPSLEGERTPFTDVRPARGTITVGNSESILYDRKASVAGLKDAKVVPGISDSLISVGRMTDEGCVVVFTNTDAYEVKGFSLPKSARKIAERRGKGLYEFLMPDDHRYVPRRQARALISDTKPDNPIVLLHHRTMHFNLRSVLKAIADGHLIAPSIGKLPKELILTKIKEMKTCEHCYRGKATLKPSARSKMMTHLPQTSLRPFQLFLCDWSARISPVGLGGEEHYLCVMCAHTRMSFVSCHAQRSEAPQAIVNALRPISTLIRRLGLSPEACWLKHDVAKEFNSKDFAVACEGLGIALQHQWRA